MFTQSLVFTCFGQIGEHSAMARSAARFQIIPPFAELPFPAPELIRSEIDFLQAGSYPRRLSSMLKCFPKKGRAWCCLSL